jgi:hypothetical protein
MTTNPKDGGRDWEKGGLSFDLMLVASVQKCTLSFFFLRRHLGMV